MYIGNKVYKARSARSAQDVERGGGRRNRRNRNRGNGQQQQNRRPRRNSILPDNLNTLTPVPEEDNEQEFIFTITNSRGSTAASERSQRTGGISTQNNRDKLSDAQRIGVDAPPSYDQVVTETRTNV